ARLAGVRRRVGGQHVIGDDRLRACEPERGNLREDLALVGNPRPKHVIERRDAIGGDDQQAVVELVDVADLALAIRTSVSECGLENGRGERQQKSSAKKMCILQGARYADNNNM